MPVRQAYAADVGNNHQPVRVDLRADQRRVDLVQGGPMPADQ